MKKVTKIIGLSKGWVKMKVNIKNDERGLLFKEGNYIKCLKPGKHLLNPFIKYSVVVSDVNKAFDAGSCTRIGLSYPVSAHFRA